MKGKSMNSLDDDCLEIIFSRLSIYDHRHDFASLSLVCKRFLTITNRLKHNLRVSNLTAPLLPKLLKRFYQLKSIEITNLHNEDCGNIIFEIAQSGLEHFEALEVWNSEKFPRAGLQALGMNMKGLKKLNLPEACFWSDDDIIGLVDWFLSLEELTISGYSLKGSQPLSDRGLEVLTSKLKGLKKIALGLCRDITDQSFISISSNCANLTDLSVRSCPRLTQNGIGYLLRNSSKLTSLALHSCLSNSGRHLLIENSISYARNLEEISICCMTIPDGLLCSIAESCPGLKKIYFNLSSDTHNFTMQGLQMLLRRCSSLQDVSLRLPWLTDECILEGCKHICGLTHINLSGCFMLSTVTLFTLIGNCPSLEYIEMNQTSVGTYEDFDVHLLRNYQVKKLILDMNKLINDRTLLRVASACPNLEFLCIGSNVSQDLTNDGIAKCLDICPQLQHLDVSYIKVSNFLGRAAGSKLKLKSIKASYTCINNDDLEVIAKRCPDLMDLVINGCNFVTNRGLKLIVSKCEKLKTIDMTGCKNITDDLLDMLVKLRLSLKEIVRTGDFVLSKEQRNLFLHNGCLLYKCK